MKYNIHILITVLLASIIIAGCTKSEKTVREINPPIQPNDTIKTTLVVKADSMPSNTVVRVTRKMIDNLSKNGLAVNAIIMVNSQTNLAEDVKQVMPWCNYYEVRTGAEYITQLQTLLSDETWHRAVKKNLFLNLPPKGAEKDSLDAMISNRVLDDIQQILAR